MFENWGFLLGEIWVLLAIAALFGPLAGWLIWSRREVNNAGDLNRISKLEGDVAQRDTRIAALENDLNACNTKVASLETAAPVVADTPLRLDGPRNGVADDLKRIKGIGPQMEGICNSLGFYHFDQIGSWTDADVAWVDKNLKGFQGRVVRDKWVEQARILAGGDETDFSQRVDKGDVPTSA